ncbi:MAG TPA: hypothetical protein VM452_14380, partial [Caulifigura sp.]|nr:hypothetical protein [Caulifigura sp.]
MRSFVIGLVLFASVLCSGVPLHAADPARLQQAIGRAAASLRGKTDAASGGYLTLSALAMLKAGLPPESPDIKLAVEGIQKRIDPVKGYLLVNDHYCYYIA